MGDACSAKATTATSKSSQRAFIQYIDPKFDVEPFAGLAHGLGE
jgi:hypothetical protein